MTTLGSRPPQPVNNDAAKKAKQLKMTHTFTGMSFLLVDPLLVLMTSQTCSSLGKSSVSSFSDLTFTWWARRASTAFLAWASEKEAGKGTADDEAWGAMVAQVNSVDEGRRRENELLDAFCGG